MKKQLTFLLITLFLASCKFPIISNPSQSNSSNSNVESSTNESLESSSLISETTESTSSSSNEIEESSTPSLNDSSDLSESSPSEETSSESTPSEETSSESTPSEEIPSESTPIEEIEESKLQVISLEMRGTYGDSFIIKYNDFEILVDAGTTTDKSYVQDALEEFVEDNTLDIVMVSHLHADHIGSMTSTSFFNEIGITVNTFVDPGTTPTTATATNYISMRNSFVSKGSKHYTYYDILNDSSIDTIWYLDEEHKAYMEFFDTGTISKPNTKPSDMNNSSIAFAVNYLNNKWLFAGDISSSAESTLVDNIKKINPNYFKDSDHVVVKANHHGSDGSNSEKFFAFTKPDIIFITAGIISDNKKNQKITRQHPYANALSRMKKYTKEVYWSSINGLTIFTSTGNEVSIDARGRTVDYYYNGKIVSRDEERYVTIFNSKWYLMM